MKESAVSQLLKNILYGVLGLGVLGTATLPFMLDTYMGIFYDAYHLEPGYRTFILIFMMAVAVLGLLIVWALLRMLRTIPADPFIPQNVTGLRRIGALCLIIAILFFLKCLLYVTFLTLAGGCLFVLCGLVAFTLADLFRQAVAFKEENDLTI